MAARKKGLSSLLARSRKVRAKARKRAGSRPIPVWWFCPWAGKLKRHHSEPCLPIMPVMYPASSRSEVMDRLWVVRPFARHQAGG